MAFTKIVSPGIDTTGSYTVQELNTVGVVTAGTVQVGSATTIHTTGIDLGSGNITSHNINSTGIITATSFVGPVTGNADTASNLTGSPSINVTNITASGNVSIAGTLTYEDVTNIDSVGIITAQSDVSIADKIVHTGDTDTAIRFPANNTFTVETAGTERLRISGTGEVSLTSLTVSDSILCNQVIVGGGASYGVANPDYRFTLGTGFFRESSTGDIGVAFSQVEKLRITAAGDVQIKVDGANGASSQQGILRFYRTAYSNDMLDSRIVFDTSLGTSSDNSGKYAATIAGKRSDDDNGSSQLSFYTCNSSNSFAAQERLRIASDGKLSLTGNTANMEYLRMGGNSDRGLRFTSSSGSSSVGVVHTINAPGDSGNQGAIVLQTNSTEKLRIDSAGNTTLGYAGSSLHFQNGFNNSTARIQNGGGSNSSELKFLVKNAGTESEKMRLTSTAGLAIVTAGSMSANAGNETLYIQGEGHNGHGTGNTRSVVSIVGALSSNPSGIGIWMGARTNENTAVIGTRTANGNLAFETYSGGWAERMRLLNTGQLIVGGSTLLSHPNMDDLQVGNASGNKGLTICSGTTGFGSVCFGDSSDGSGNDRYEGFVEYYHGDNSLRLGTSHTEKVNITSAGDIRMGPSSFGAPKTKLDIIEDQTIPFAVTANTGTFVGVMVRTRYYLEFSVEFPQHATQTSIQLKFSRTSNAPSISIDYFSGGGYQIDHGVTGVAYISFYAASGNTLYSGTNHQSAYGAATPSWSHSGGTTDVLFKLSNIAYSNGSMCHFRINMPRGGINNVTVDRTTP